MSIPAILDKYSQQEYYGAVRKEVIYMVIIEKLMSLFPRGAKPQTETPETFGGDPRNNADQIWVDGKIAAIADREGGYAEFHRELRRWDAAMRGERAYIEE